MVRFLLSLPPPNSTLSLNPPPLPPPPAPLLMLLLPPLSSLLTLTLTLTFMVAPPSSLLALTLIQTFLLFPSSSSSPRAHPPTPLSPSPTSSSPITDLEHILNKSDSNDDDNISTSKLVTIFSSLNHPLSSSKLSRMMVGAVISFVQLPPPLIIVANSIANFHTKPTSSKPPATSPPLPSTISVKQVL